MNGRGRRQSAAALCAAAVIAAGALAGCGGDSPGGGDAPSSAPSDAGTAVTVAPGEARLTVADVAERTTIDVEVSAPGNRPSTRTFRTQLGQVGTMTVSQEG
jgi:ABC-type glycerol-3-phosphate transport system substrate-binding protein